MPIHTGISKRRSGPVLLLRESRAQAGPFSKLETFTHDNNTKKFNHLPLGCPLLSMLDQLLGGVKCYPYELIGSKEEEELAQARKIITLLTSRCNLTTNGSPQETLAE